MRTTCVITGDLVSSSELSDADYQKRIEALTSSFKELRSIVDLRYQLFRGDSFQIEVREAEEAARVAILIRLMLKAQFPKKGEADVRVTAALAKTQSKALKLGAESSLAHRMSGLKLEELRSERLFLVSENSGFNERVALLTRFCDALITDLTSKQSQVLSLYLLNPKVKQAELAEKEGVSAVNISKTLTSSHYKLISDYAQEVRSLVKRLLQ